MTAAPKIVEVSQAMVVASTSYFLSVKDCVTAARTSVQVGAFALRAASIFAYKSAVSVLNAALLAFISLVYESIEAYLT